LFVGVAFKKCPASGSRYGACFHGKVGGIVRFSAVETPYSIGLFFFTMDYNYLSCRVKALQKELGEIALHNRKYFNKSHHSDHERVEHKARIERVTEIRAELRTLMDQTAA
jgi:hypothetical protein